MSSSCAEALHHSRACAPLRARNTHFPREKSMIRIARGRFARIFFVRAQNDACTSNIGASKPGAEGRRLSAAWESAFVARGNRGARGDRLQRLRASSAFGARSVSLGVLRRVRAMQRSERHPVPRGAWRLRGEVCGGGSVGRSGARRFATLEAKPLSSQGFGRGL